VGHLDPEKLSCGAFRDTNARLLGDKENNVKLQLKSNPRRTFDVEASLAEILVLWPGSPVEPVPAPAPKRVPKTSWSVNRSTFTQELYIHAKCATCHDVVNNLGPTAHEHKFIHCGVAEPVPADIAEQYQRMLPKKKVRFLS